MDPLWPKRKPQEERLTVVFVKPFEAMLGARCDLVVVELGSQDPYEPQFQEWLDTLKSRVYPRDDGREVIVARRVK